MTDLRSPIIVFVGPSVQKSDLPTGKDWIIQGPVAQGDVIKTVLEFGPCTIAILDGFFQRQPAVRHKEILWALAKGTRVFGAASMGALRAAELSDHGMVGYGLIYRWLRRNPLAPDDAVAVTHGPAEVDHIALSRALIDFRMTFKAMRKSGLVDPAEEQLLARIATELPFPERQIDKLIELAGTRGISLIEDELSSHFVHQKEIDALGLLNHLSMLRERGSLSQPEAGTPFVVTDAFLADAEAAGVPLDRL